MRAIIFWLDASCLGRLGNDGDPILVWEDRSGNHREGISSSIDEAPRLIKPFTGPSSLLWNQEADPGPPADVFGKDVKVGWTLSGAYAPIPPPDPYYWCSTAYAWFLIATPGTVTFRLYVGDATYPGGTLTDTQVYPVDTGDLLEVAAASLYEPFYWTVDDGGGEVQYHTTICGYSYDLKPYPDPLVVVYTPVVEEEEEQLWMLIFEDGLNYSDTPNPANDVVDEDAGLVMARRTGGGSNRPDFTSSFDSIIGIGNNGTSDITLTIQLRDYATHAVIETQTALFEFNEGMGWHLKRIAKDTRFYIRITSSAGGSPTDFYSRLTSTISDVTYPWVTTDYPDGIVLTALDTGISEYSVWNGQTRDRPVLDGDVTITEADVGTVYDLVAPGGGYPYVYTIGPFYMRNRYGIVMPGAVYSTSGAVVLPAEIVTVWPVAHADKLQHLLTTIVTEAVIPSPGPPPTIS